MVGTDIMEKFINCLLNDTNHCLEEGIAKLSTIKAYQTKVSSGHFPTEDEQKKHGENEGVCKANLQLANK